jgi:riboflavin kinase/FMN adenylyltransferase
MQRVTHLSELSLTPGQTSLLTIGVFDGVHLGHQALIGRLVAEAHAAGHLAAVMSFFPHPDVVLRGLHQPYYLTPADEKARLVADLGADIFILHPFDESLRQMRAADFVAGLAAHLNIRGLWATADFALGYQREGDIAFLRAQGEHYGYEVHTIEFIQDGERISSTRIRQALSVGQFEQALAWLGRPYRLGGPVVRGDQRGRQLGFPTANLAVWEEQLLPLKGVYAGYALLGEERHPMVANIGERPTFGGGAVKVEAHLLAWEGELYGQTLELDLLHRLRGEQKFANLEALKAQIAADAAQARALLLG